jgi:hypothetical protein
LADPLTEVTQAKEAAQAKDVSKCACKRVASNLLELSES